MKTRKFRKSMLSAVVILMAAILSLTGATYAWFTTGDQADVGGINASVESGTGLLISTDGASWTSEVNFSVKEGFKLLALSSAGNVVSGQLELFRASLNTKVTPNEVEGATKASWTQQTTSTEGENPVTTTYASREGGFIAFDVYFNNANGVAKDIKVTGGLANGTNDKMAVRVAFIKQGVVSAAEAGVDLAEVITAKALTSGTAGAELSSAVKIHEPFANDHITNGLLDYKTYKSNATINDNFEYFGITKEFTGSFDRYGKDVTEGAPELLKVTTLQTDEGSYDSAMFTVDAASYVKITVVIWLEGQDADCLNEISGGSINYDIGFAVAANNG